jgi:integrase/recombinase XerC
MNALAEKFLETLGRTANTKKTYRNALEQYFGIVGDNLSDEAYKKFMTAIRKHSPSTKRIYSTAVNELFKFGDIGNPAYRDKLNEHFIEPARITNVIFDRDGIEKIITYCDTLQGDLIQLRDRAFVLTLADSGFRISELAGLKRGDIDWKERRVFLADAKGGQPALVRLSERSVAALQKYLKARAQLDGASGKPLNSLPLFAQHGRINKIKPMTIDGMRNAIKDRMKEAGAEVRLHDFRHYFVTMVVIATEGNMKVAQTLARHKSIGMTQRYTHYAETEIDQQYDTIFNQK